MMSTYTAIPGEKHKTKSGVFVCPFCGNEHWMVSIEENKSTKCLKCGKIMAKNEEEINKLLVEKEVNAYICPVCGITVDDTPLNYTGDCTIDGEMSILCPKCRNFVNGLPFIHHGMNSENFELRMSQTDYFYAFHKPCKDKDHHGFCDIYACLIDNSGRIIFDLQCQDCKTVDAVKTHAGERGQTIERIFLSPNLRRRIAKQSWDNR